MFIERKRLRRAALLGSTAACLAYAANTPAASAQDLAAEEVEIEQMVVTGSRIVGQTFESPSPIQVIDAGAIQQSGAINIQDLLLESPVFGTPALSRTNSAFLTSGTGVATVDLRDLGSDRTLVLVNGRRVVSGLPGSAIVDLNVIPTPFIERVEILTGGASSLYGSDAVAGVVNFIYKTDFEGVEINGRFGITEEGDDETYDANITMGGNFADGRGNAMLFIGHTDQEGVRSSERSNTQVDDLSLFRDTRDPADFGVPLEPFFSSFPPQGRFNSGGTNFTFDPNGTLIEGFSTNGPAGDGVGANGFNRQAFRTIAVPVERYMFAGRASYEIHDNVTLFAEGTYNRTESSRIIEPFPLGSDDIFPFSAGLVPIEVDTGGGILEVNPFVPDDILAAATDRDGDGLRDITFARRITEFGPRQGRTTRDFYRFVVGAQGTFLEDRFNWDFSYNYGTTIENQFSSGQVNVVNFRNALQVRTDTEDFDNDADTTDLVCANPDAVAEGCVPVNIFGVGSISQDAVGYIDAGASFQTDITQQVISGNVSGTLVDLPAGPLAAAVGIEYRKESSVEELDALTNAGLNAGNALPDTRGEFDVVEFYTEVNVPVLADLPFAHRLNLIGAVRVADYSTVGTVTSYNGGAEWSPIADIRVRGSYARSVRAPNVAELFTGPSQTFPSGLTDPCEEIGPTGGGALGDNCRADPGVAANIAANGEFTVNQADQQGISGFNVGNPDLKEEESDSFTIGVQITPSFVPGLENLRIEVDYFNIEIDDAIQAPARGFTLDQCYRKGNQDFCDLITRRSAATALNSVGSLEFVDAPQRNSGGLEVEGIDVVVSWNGDLEEWGLVGSLDARVAYTHYIDGFVVPLVGEPANPFVGEIGTAENQFTANLTYNIDTVTVGFTGTYIGSSEEDDQFIAAFEAFDVQPGSISVGSEFYLDTQVSWVATENFEFFGGIDNIFDNDAPNILSGTTFNVTGTDTAADVYDVFGRRYYFGARLRF